MRCVDFSDDIIATMEAMKALGAKIYQNKNYIEIQGINHNEDNKELKIIDCNESGSTLRFLVPISLLIPGKKKFIGRGNLGKRPLNTFYEIFEQDNIEYSFEEGILNLQLEGTLKGGEYYLAGNISSQFITGLLFTLPLINRDSKIIITTEMESKGYFDLTLSALRDFGIEIINNDYKEFIIKGYVMDDARLREPENLFGKDYFEEQLERIRDIRSSERRFYQKITDIYSQCSADYDVNSPVTKEFFATVQNKLHYTVTHHTAAEIVYGRADSTKPNMGLTTWKNAPQGRIRKSDVSIAKNYLNEEEMINLNEIVTMYLDYAERQARRGNIMYMRDWVNRLDAFLQFNEEDILHDKGKVTAAIAKAFAESEFEKFRVLQDRTYQSDFDRLVANIEENSKQTK